MTRDEAGPRERADAGRRERADAGRQGRREEVAEAAHVLAGLGLVTAFGHVSARVGGAMLITPAADLAQVSPDGLIEVPLEGAPAEGAALPAGAPAETWAHLAVYRQRPDADAVARAQPPSAFAAAAAAGPAGGGGAIAILPLYGQAAWLGQRIPVHDDARLMRSAALADAAAASLPDGEALLLRGNGALTLGATPGLAVARMWLLSVACQVFLDARAAGGGGGGAAGAAVTPLRPAEIESWRAVAPELLPRLWQHLRAR
jgi:ribulose-5-phosphate 4-epimerase/fuculose-1-phosphate aldolase